MLLFLIKNQPKGHSTYTWFDNTYTSYTDQFLNTVQDKDYIKNKTSQAKKNKRKRMRNVFNKIANDIIDKRNNKTVHYKDIATLEHNIEKIRGLFINHPELKISHPDEYFMISNYELLKMAFQVA